MIKQREIEDIPHELHSTLEDNLYSIRKINDREFKEQEVPTKATIKEAIDIFYIVNAAGANLTDAELALAQISGYWPEARALFKEKLKKLNDNGFVFKYFHGKTFFHYWVIYDFFPSLFKSMKCFTI